MILYQYCIFFVKKLQYWNNFLYQYCQQYWYTSIVIAKYRRSHVCLLLFLFSKKFCLIKILFFINLQQILTQYLYKFSQFLPVSLDCPFVNAPSVYFTCRSFRIQTSRIPIFTKECLVLSYSPQTIVEILLILPFNNNHAL